MPGSGTSRPLVLEVVVDVVEVVDVEVSVGQLMWPQPQVCVCQPLVEPPEDHQVAEAGAAAVMPARATAAITDLRNILDPLFIQPQWLPAIDARDVPSERRRG